MCGIFCSLSRNRHVYPGGPLSERLACRGPDHTGRLNISWPYEGVAQQDTKFRNAYISIQSTVLSLRGTVTVPQPYSDDDGDYVLCWNGEAWSINGHTSAQNDTRAVHELLKRTVQDFHREHQVTSAKACCESVSRALSSVAGPYAFVFLDRAHGMLFFGRDFLGRRSLLQSITDDGDFLLSSVSGGEPNLHLSEVDADGIYVIDLNAKRSGAHNCDSENLPSGTFAVDLVPYTFRTVTDTNDPRSSSVCNFNTVTWATNAHVQVIPQLSLNTTLPSSQSMINKDSLPVAKLGVILRSSLSIRVLNIPDPPAVSPPGQTTSKLAILFSGGLDCTVLARLAHDLLHLHESIDLLNVAFENPRIHGQNHSIDRDTDLYETCPDRITGRASYAELQRVCPDREWRFVAINVPYTEFVANRETVISLMRPHNTEMDLSIASALYFAARGDGVTSASGGVDNVQYTTTARVLLSGLGADELFGGYTRHATASKRGGMSGLVSELELDISRLGKRNLGRDDRVTSHWSKEVRYPYLDESLLSWALDAPINEKCGFGEPPHESNGYTVEDSSMLEPGKKVLRCLAWKLGMTNVAAEKKRAIQFGARTAKMEKGRKKGTQLVA